MKDIVFYILLLFTIPSAFAADSFGASVSRKGGNEYYPTYLTYNEKGLISLSSGTIFKVGWGNNSLLRFFEIHLEDHQKLFKKYLEWSTMAEGKDKQPFNKKMGDAKCCDLKDGNTLDYEYVFFAKKTLADTISTSIECYAVTRNKLGVEIDKSLSAVFSKESIEFFVKNFEEFESIKKELLEHKSNVEKVYK